MNYGVPYKGSKNKIAAEIINLLPAAENFYDLFAGGCAVTHAAILSGKYRNILANDLDGRGVQLFRDAVDGKYRNEKRWISREEFMRLRDTDPYVALCWSFGNNMRDYMYSYELEPGKKLLHEMLFAGTPGERYAAWRIFAKKHIYRVQERKNGYELQRLESLERLQSLESLERLERLGSLEKLESAGDFTISKLNYQDVQIPADTVIYCDVPYSGKRTTDGGSTAYNSRTFDYDRFYDWCAEQTELTVISEYSMPDGFVPIWQKEKTVNSCATQTTKAIEKLFIPEHQAGMWNE